MANLTYRQTKGTALTIAELDGNFEYFTGSHAITGSLIVSSGITGSLLGDASTSITASIASDISSLSTRITNNTNNYILTSLGTGDINGEENLTFDGSVLVMTGSFLNSGTNIFTGTTTSVGSLVVTGSLILENSSSFVLPLTSSVSPLTGSAFFSGSLLYIYDGTRYMSASLA
jgi:hypothetical protein